MATFGRRLLLAVDAKGYGGVDVLTQRQFQEAIQRLLAEAADASGLDRERWETQEGGDSVLAVLPDGASEPDLVDPFMRRLDAGLRAFNHGRLPEAWLRLRAAVHFGTASPAPTGFVGRAPVEIGRILDSAVLRSALAAVPDACLALAVSATVFNDVVGEAYTTFRAQEFREVRIAEKEYVGRAWVWVPGADLRALELGGGDGAAVAEGDGAAVAGGGGEAVGDGGGEAAAVRPPSAPTPTENKVVTVNYGTIHTERAVFGIHN
ncbi:hypothetical protein OG223_28280 [Streptomyces sp. NBC_01478]|jgi:hypothetical protein|uniref:hypothetical protein n=1 Tax=Streptomyces sp. NBC_01478 TaxID=2903882 RepID=UPI002E321DD4|nr:hypothetical protein [Streptomyces sp. NBC_01478]